MIEDLSMIREAAPRTYAQVKFPDETLLEAPVGTPLEAYVHAYERRRTTDGALTVAAIVDGSLRELTMPVTRDVCVELVRTDSGDGSRIYRRSLAFLLTVAAAELFPGTQVIVDYALPSGAFFCKVRARPPFTSEELEAIKARMREIVAACDPITRHRIPLDEARRMFDECGDDDKGAAARIPPEGLPDHLQAARRS
ncbi:MAG: hypothetical protein M5U29_12710 [Anaerolineae bacterium]|nr:hypothetical protein [Anaerolineae bacterium]